MGDNSDNMQSFINKLIDKLPCNSNSHAKYKAGVSAQPAFEETIPELLQKR